MAQLTEFAPAKINLALHIVGKRPDGYHLLDMLVAFCAIGDRIGLSPSSAFGLQISGPFAQDLDASPSNLAWCAAKLLSETAGRPLSDGILLLEKNLPVASGIGGGSTDAAATIRALSHHWNVQLDNTELANLALALGADVPMCMSPHTCRVSGIGEVIDRIELPLLHVLLVNPGGSLSTGLVFGNTSIMEPPTPMTAPKFHNIHDVISYLKHCRNDLQPAAIDLVPEIAHCLGALEAQPEVMLSRMSGSGATCFGLFPTYKATELAQANISHQYPNWWVQSTQTLA